MSAAELTKAYLDQIAADERWAWQVNRLRAFRGIDTITAMTLLVEIGDIRRFWQRREKTDSAPSAGGNGPCPCGSGKKYRQCCGANPTLH